MLQKVPEFFRRNIAGMAIFAVITGVAGNFLYESLKADPTAPTRTGYVTNSAPGFDAKAGAVIDAIIAELRRSQPNFASGEASRSAIRSEVLALNASLAKNPGTLGLVDPVNRSLLSGNLAAAETMLLANAAQAAKTRDMARLDALTSALSSLYRIEGSSAKVDALQRLLDVASIPPIHASASAQPPALEAKLKPSTTNPSPLAETSQNQPVVRPPAVQPNLQQTGPEQTFSIQSQSQTEFEVSIPMQRVAVSFSGVNLQSISALLLYAERLDPSACIPFMAMRTTGTAAWQRNFVEQTQERITVSFVPVVVGDPAGSCRWTLRFSGRSGSTVTRSVVVRYSPE